MNRPLTSLLNDLGDCRVHGSKVVSVSGITSDSRRVVPGMAFVAVEGTSDDGHRYVGEAIERGASVVVGKEPDVAVGKRTFVQVGKGLCVTKSVIGIFQRAEPLQMPLNCNAYFLECETTAVRKW